MPKKQYLYWLLPILIFAFQFIYIQDMSTHIRQEELTESVSNVFWFQKGNVCSGITTNVGWYAQLLIFYKLFGFNLIIIKIYKLLLVISALFSLAWILKKFLGEKLAWFPLLVIGLSPTFIYFNSLSSQHGIDLLYFPILFFLFLQIKFTKSVFDLVTQSLFWFLFMIAWMSYPSMIYYLPFFGGLFLYNLLNKWKKGQPNLVYRSVLISALAFLTPLLMSFVYVKQKNSLIYDPATATGLFRGNGAINIDPLVIIENLKTLFSDLFLTYSSYYFEIPKVEFSDFYPVLVVITVLIVCGFAYFQKKSWRIILLISFIYLILNILLSGLGGSLGGLRRSGIVLVIFYGLYCFSWYYIQTIKRINIYFKYSVIVILSLLLAHHLFVFQENLSYLKQPSGYEEGAWFSQAETPQKSLNKYLDQITRNDLSLICVDEKGNPQKCQRYGYNLIYPAVAGSCDWNKLSCHQLKYYNFKSNKVELLTLDCWNDNI